MQTVTRSFRTPLFLAVLLLLVGLLLVMRTPPTLAAGAAAPALFSPVGTDCATQTDIPQAECQALVAFYTSTNGASWKDSPANNWNVTQFPCSWTGVVCSAGSPGHVTQIQLAGNNLVGSIPDLSALSSLQILFLYNNQLSGSIPALSAFSSLQILSLYGNQLSGSIPALSALTSLQALDLGSNQLSGSIPALSALTGLKYLFLYGNQLSGSIPTILPASLQYLSLNGNQLSGSIPALSALTGLQFLYLNNNQLSGIVPAGVCNTTRVLDLGYNKLTGEADPCVTTMDPDWATTQTVPPTNVQAQALSDTEIKLTWTAIPYTGDGGYYKVLCGTTSGGPYNSQGTTADKTVTTLSAGSLSPGTPYYCVVRTFTPSHGDQQNNLTSLDSDKATATTDAILYLPLQYHLHHLLAGD